MISNKFNAYIKNVKRGLVPLFISLLFGCSTLPLTERTYAPDGRQIVARDDNVEVQIGKKDLFWFVFYVNKNDVSKCVVTDWKVFDLMGKVTNRMVYVEPNTIRLVGLFAEETWDFGNLKISLGGSGYVEEFYAIDPYDEREDCLYPKGE